MSKLSGKLEKELNEDDQLASLRLEYKFEGIERDQPSTNVYRAKERSSGEEVVVRFFELDAQRGRRGVEGAQLLSVVEPESSDQDEADEGTDDGLGNVSNSIQDAGTDSIPDSIAEASEAKEQERPALRFKREPIDADDLLLRLSHPHLVEVEGFWQGKNLVATASEPVDVEPFVSSFGDSSLLDEPDRVAEFGRDLADALGYIHERGALHLGVAPDNVGVDREDAVRLLNTGVTELIEGCLEGEEAEQIRGTPGYTAPERYDASDDRIGPWSDLYALGAFLFRAATGTAPFNGTNNREIIERQLRGEMVEPRSVNPRISPFLERVILRLLRREPSERYQSADELVWDLEKYLELPSSERFEVRREPRVWDTGLSSTGGVFFGRQTEMDRLTSHLAVEAERPHVAVVRGSRGVGKTALLEYQIERLERQELGPIYAQSAGDLDSVAAVVMLARGAVRTILESNQVDTEGWRAHFRQAPVSIRTLVHRIPRLGRLLPEGRTEPVTSDDNRRALMRNVVAWRDLFEVLLEGPTSFTWIIDDLHQLGELSGEILAEFIHRRDDLPSRWLLSQTPGENPNGDEWIAQNIEDSESAVEILGLESLEREQVRAYFNRLLHASEDLLERFVDRLMGVSGGRPELIQIALQQLTDSGAVAFRAGKLRIDGRHLESVDLADDLAAYALRAWTELAGGQRELAYNVALVGDCIPVDLLFEVSSVPREEFEDQLAALCSKRILEVTDATYSRLVSCTEDTVREFVRKQLNQSEFERRHRMLAFEFSDFYDIVEDDRFDAGWLAVNIAQQWVAAGEPERAIDWLARAGRIRLTEGRVLNALRLLQEGMLRADDPLSVYADGLSMVELLGDANAAAGEGADAVERYREALDRSDDLEEIQRLRLKLGRGLQHRQAYQESYRVVAAYLQERGIEVPASEERLAFSVCGLVLKYLMIRAMFRLGVMESTDAPEREVTRELEHFEATQILAYNLRQHDNWFPLIWIDLSTENRAHQMKDTRLLAVNYAGHALMCCQLPYPLPGRAQRFRDLALEQAEKCDDDRVRSFVGATATSLSLKLGDHEETVRYARMFRPIAVSEGAFSDYQDILESLIYLALYTGDVAAADQLVNRFVADARAFGTYEVGHLTNYFQAYVEFLKGDYAEARKHLGESRSVNQRAQDATCHALQAWIDFELLWRYGQKREAVTTARESVRKIEGNLRDVPLAETICRAARLASRAALESREGNLQHNPEELLEFAEHACDLAEKRTEAFPTLRALVRCEQGRLAWVRGQTEEALGRLDQAIMEAEAYGQSRFQAVAYELRAHVESDDAPLRALADARRSRALFASCGFSEAVDRLDEDIETLLETRADLEAFTEKFGIRSPEVSELAEVPESETERNPFRTIELSPDESIVEEVRDRTEETLRPWQGESEVLAAMVPPSPDASGEREAIGAEQEGDRRPARPPTFDKSLEESSPSSTPPMPDEGGSESGEMPMPPSPRKPDSLDTDDQEEEGGFLSSSGTGSGGGDEESSAEDTEPPTIPPPKETAGESESERAETADLESGEEPPEAAETSERDVSVELAADASEPSEDSENWLGTQQSDPSEGDTEAGVGAQASETSKEDTAAGMGARASQADSDEGPTSDEEEEEAESDRSFEDLEREKRGTRSGMGPVSEASADAESDVEEEASEESDREAGDADAEESGSEVAPADESGPTTKVKGDVMEAVAASDGVPPELQDDEDGGEEEPPTQKLDRDEIEGVVEDDDEDSPPPIPDGQDEERTG